MSLYLRQHAYLSQLWSVWPKKGFKRFLIDPSLTLSLSYGLRNDIYQLRSRERRVVGFIANYGKIRHSIIFQGPCKRPCPSLLRIWLVLTLGAYGYTRGLLVHLDTSFISSFSPCIPFFPGEVCVYRHQPPTFERMIYGPCHYHQWIPGKFLHCFHIGYDPF